MTSIAQAAITASVLVGLISIPAVSKTAETVDSVEEDIPDISNEEASARTVTKTNSPDSFRASIETAFDSFRTYVNSGKMNATLENSNSNLEVEQTPQKTEWKLTTSGGTLEITETGEKTVERVSTSDGELEIRKQNGARTEKFTGTDRNDLEEARTELKQLMKERKQKLDDKRKQLEKTSKPRVEIKANKSTAAGYGNNSQEHVILVNNDREAIDLEGWEIENNNPARYAFGKVLISPGEKLHVFSSNREDVVIETDNAVYDTGLTWENGGDTVRLLDDKGTEIAKETY